MNLLFVTFLLKCECLLRVSASFFSFFFSAAVRFGTGISFIMFFSRMILALLCRAISATLQQSTVWEYWAGENYQQDFLCRFRFLFSFFIQRLQDCIRLNWKTSFLRSVADFVGNKRQLLRGNLWIKELNKKSQHSCSKWAAQPYPLSRCPIVTVSRCTGELVSQGPSVSASWCPSVPVTWEWGRTKRRNR